MNIEGDVIQSGQRADPKHFLGILVILPTLSPPSIGSEICLLDNSALVFVLLPTLIILITSRPALGADMFWFTRFSSAKRIIERLPTARIKINRMTMFI
jgi:hypothetical protein